MFRSSDALAFRLSEENLRQKSSSIDVESQTDDQGWNKQIQLNQKLKRALQMMKEKIHRMIDERIELFPQQTDETLERLEQISSLIDRQKFQMNDLEKFVVIERVDASFFFFI